MTRFAKIVATLGPASSDEKTLTEMVQAGLDVARLNFSHGEHASHAALVELIRQISNKLGKPVTILMDLQGPKLRVGDLGKDGLNLKSGQ